MIAKPFLVRVVASPPNPSPREESCVCSPDSFRLWRGIPINDKVLVHLTFLAWTSTLFSDAVLLISSWTLAQSSFLSTLSCYVFRRHG